MDRVDIADALLMGAVMRDAFNTDVKVFGGESADEVSALIMELYND